jgi:threonine dehydrogenase-like Zn-dependent dehydrogenase
MKVAVLGCGPTGLSVVHAAVASGADVAIYSRARKSRMFGAQYLHAPIAGIECGEPVNIKYKLLGDAETYRQRVYGDRQVTVSVEELDEDHQAWDIRATYDKLWALYGSEVRDTFITSAFLDGNIFNDFDFVFSTLPAPALCAKRDEHIFASQTIWACGDAPELGQMVAADVPANTVLCNGLGDAEGPSWYRASNIFGWRTVEWPLGAQASNQAARYAKPIGTSCDCWPRLTRLGRFGKWQKGVLVHHAYQEASEWMSL